VDIFPTVLEEAGIDFSAMGIDGQSLIPLIRGKSKDDRMFLADIASHVLASRIPRRIAVNQGKEKLILSQPFSPEELSFFLHPPPDSGPVELYDLALDPEEQRNIADDRPESANLLIRKIDEIVRAVPEKKTKKLEMDEDLKKHLRALGYIR
jgi:arylsulfatase A-like enzyme